MFFTAILQLEKQLIIYIKTITSAWISAGLQSARMKQKINFLQFTNNLLGQGNPPKTKPYSLAVTNHIYFRILINSLMKEITEKQKLLIEEHKRFFKRFQEKYKSVEKFKIINDKQRFSHLLSGTKTIKSIYDNISKHFAYGFNIFKILRNIKTKEEITHTPLLNNLLNINGSHKQKKLFYDNLLKRLFDCDKNIAYFSDIQKDFFNISAEKSTFYGRLDILIEHYSKTNPFVICIENKIYANDQPLQLERYYNFLKTKSGQKILIYLTINGKKPTTAPEKSQDYINAKKGIGNVSISDELYNDLIDRKIIKLLSYKNDIAKILELSRKDIKSENVKEIVNQYNNLIKTL